jgi:hypothetical protein
MTTIMEAGAMGCEIGVAGKLRSDRAHKEKYRMGVVPKSGETADEIVRSATTDVLLKLGLFGIKVKIAIADALPPPIEFIDMKTETQEAPAAPGPAPEAPAPQATAAEPVVAVPAVVEVPTSPAAPVAAPAAAEPEAPKAKKTRAKRATKATTGTRKRATKKKAVKEPKGEEKIAKSES